MLPGMKPVFIFHDRMQNFKLLSDFYFQAVILEPDLPRFIQCSFIRFDRCLEMPAIFIS